MESLITKGSAPFNDNLPESSDYPFTIVPPSFQYRFAGAFAGGLGTLEARQRLSYLKF
jgi:hypothetical protein